MQRGKRLVQRFALLLVIALSLMAVQVFALPGRQAVRADANGVKVMPLGDSITYGTGSSNGGGYRLPLWNDLLAQGANIHFVGSQQNGPSTFDTANEGHPGWRIDQISANIVGWLQTYQPQIVLLHIGTNDILQQHDVVNAPTRLASLIDQITTTAPNATVVVAQILPIKNAMTQTVTYNNTIPGIVQSRAAQGKHVQYVDMYDAVSVNLLPDGIHPDDPGYRLMATVWDDALIHLLSPLSGYYKLVNRNSGKLLDVTGASVSDGTKVIQWTDHNGTNQEWQFIPVGEGFVKLVNRNSGKVLDVNGASTTQGTQLDQTSDSGGRNQQWQISSSDGKYDTLVNRNSGQLADVTMAQTTDGAAVIQWPTNGGLNQQWQLVPVA
ncbi:MAG: RICIN domain-containing protein [Ktedonobacteraceae bacterium]|nr:RICIN domain-containing protein [Ktedonobacteraceae bacterium]